MYYSPSPGHYNTDMTRRLPLLLRRTLAHQGTLASRSGTARLATEATRSLVGRPAQLEELPPGVLTSLRKVLGGEGLSTSKGLSGC